jgi:uncharacterized alpha-E superfamily protein
MLSRVADSIYWAARYLERAENTARFIDVNLQMSLDAPIAFSGQWQPLVAITGDRPSFQQRYSGPTRDSVIQFLTSDAANPSSILSCLGKARENARSVREVISSETWEQVNRLYLLVSRGDAGRRALADSYAFFSEVKLLSHVISGVIDNTMSHGQAWHFYRLGRMLERADNTSRLIDVKYFLLLPSIEDVGGPIDELQWSILLRSATALEMYRKRHGRISPEGVVDFLLLNTEFPRAILFCLSDAEESLHAVSGAPAGTFRNSPEKILGGLRSDLAYAQVYDIIAAGLHEFLEDLQLRLNAVGDGITETFFAIKPMGSSKTSRGEGSSDVLPRYQSQRWTGGDSGYARDLGQ